MKLCEVKPGDMIVYGHAYDEYATVSCANLWRLKSIRENSPLEILAAIHCDVAVGCSFRANPSVGSGSPVYHSWDVVHSCAMNDHAPVIIMHFCFVDARDNKVLEAYPDEPGSFTAFIYSICYYPFHGFVLARTENYLS